MNAKTLGDLAAQCLERGLDSLSPEQQRELRDLFQKEARKGAYRPGSLEPEPLRREFCEYVVSHFGASSSVKHVLDFQPYLRRQALALAGQLAPIAALVLYATWIEHWLNMVISVAMLRRGDSAQAPLEYLATQPPLEDKVSSLGPRLGLPPLDKKPRDCLVQVVKTRNRYVHYTWEGAQLSWYRKDLAGMRALVRRCERLLSELESYEHSNFDAAFEKHAMELFPHAG